MSDKLTFDLTDDVRSKLVKSDFRFFLDKNIAENKYSPTNIESIYYGKLQEDKIIDSDIKNNKKQQLIFMEGQVAKMVRGGMLPCHFNMNETREYRITDFEEYGKNWSIFEAWKKAERRKVIGKRIWNTTVKVGAILAILLSVIKVLEIVGVKI